MTTRRKAPGPRAPRDRGTGRVKAFSIWDVDELTRFCDWAVAKDEPWARAWVILARTGLRSGELLGLRWGDLDFSKSEMRIERALHCDETLPLGERFVVGPVKGGRPRTVTYDQTCSLLFAGLAEGVAIGAGRGDWQRDSAARPAIS